MRVFIISRGIPSKQNMQYGIFEFDQAKALKSAGHEVVFLSLDIRSIRRWRKWGSHSFIQENIPIEEYNFPCGRMPFQIYMILGEFAFNRLLNIAIKKYGVPDVVHAHFYSIACLCARTVKKRGIPFVVTEHSSKINYDILSRSTKKMADIAYKNADAIIAVSSPLSKSIREKLGYHSIVVGNVLDTYFISQKINKKSQKDEDFFTFVSCGNLIGRKNFDILIDAFSKLNNKKTRLIIVGGGPLHNQLLQQSIDLNLEDRVEFKGKKARKDLVDIYNNSDCFVLASKVETFGVVFIEALSCGLPIIATKSGGPEDFINKKNGILVDVDNVNQLICAMEYILRNFQNYNRQAISDQIKEKFSSDSISKKIIEVYRQAIKNN